jgi:hypothetical protein
MGLPKTSPEDQVKALEKTAQNNYLTLANDLLNTLDQIKTELKAKPEILDIDQFKQRVRSNVNFGWKELTPKGKGYYYPKFPLFEANAEQVDKYWERLWSLTTDSLVKTFTDYVEAHSSAINIF